jgi:hypothetical protein
VRSSDFLDRAAVSLEGENGTGISPTLRGFSPSFGFAISLLNARWSVASPMVFGGTDGICGVRDDRLVTARGLDATEVLLSRFALLNLATSDFAINSAFLRDSC